MCDVFIASVTAVPDVAGGIQQAESNLTIDGHSSFVNNSAAIGGKEAVQRYRCIIQGLGSGGP